MAAAFYPPKPSSSLIRLVQIMAPPVACLFFKMRLRISAADLATLRSLQHQRVILLCNHPSFNDPVAVMLLSAKLHKGYYYLTSVEQFDGPLGWIFQRIGSYSVRRGLSDRQSLKQTQRLLRQADTHLVVFPEGGCSFQNETVMPFRPGAIQIALQTLVHQVRQGQAPPDCYVVPLALKYEYSTPLGPVIDTLLGRLEAELGLERNLDHDPYQRLRTLAIAVLEQVEADYGLPSPPPSRDLTPRIETLRQEILRQCEQSLQIQTNPQALVRERTYQIEFALRKMTESANAPDGQGPEASLPAALIEKSIQRLLNFNAIYDGYVAESPTPERFLDTLTRFEREVFSIDRPKIKGFRWAHLRVGAPVNLRDWLQAYEAGRSQTVETLSEGLRQQVQSMLTPAAPQTSAPLRLKP
ncbi:1-acyl-sn-glycerol-3-phosphate acyltransferase [Lyngbya confervoides]|uniref:1-acyl-sn-glycerol-3-phosphate acyltransferase n=1 Tax=Lyngbya confervoides BDU141951 TaxID=1574623 RepID=A0ABD4SZE5_9CYAN|nr:1-acyl-sn-glycerol-3-phosphate acyltransferase [Lyngbya confervoides]MCM1981679.1 1-acyl-sn-glycerol-3-phosphate acyltransferase [Lyngbya confervoides BDU141951]